MTALIEQYRPRQWSDVVGQDALIARIDALRPRGLGGRAYWLVGQSGTGKTTIARLIAAELASECCVEEIDAQYLTPARVRAWQDSASMYGIGKGGRAYIVNEAHGLKADTVRALLVALEAIPSHVAWVFTTTNESAQETFDGMVDAPPLYSRMATGGPLQLARRGLADAFAVRCKAIATAEHLDGQDLSEYVKLAKKCSNNMRSMLGAIESGCMVATAAA